MSPTAPHAHGWIKWRSWHARGMLYIGGTRAVDDGSGPYRLVNVPDMVRTLCGRLTRFVPPIRELFPPADEKTCESCLRLVIRNAEQAAAA